MNKEKYRNSTTLSSHIWNLKDRNKQYDVTWKIISRKEAYKPGSKTCRLCLEEIFSILRNKKESTLNKRKEIWNHEEAILHFTPETRMMIDFACSYFKK